MAGNLQNKKKKKQKGIGSSIFHDSHQDDISTRFLMRKATVMTVQMPIGDLLSEERITGAKRLRRGCNKASERRE